jgi:hypothetical protein
MKEDRNNIESSKIDKFNFELTEDTKLAIEEFSLNLNKTIKEFSTTIGSMMQDILPGIQLMMSNILEPIKDIDWKSFSEFVSKLDVNDIYLNMYATAISENRELIQLFYDNTIFPPLHYIIDKQVEFKDIQIPVNIWIHSEDIKLYYLGRINEWKNKYKDRSVHALIDEIYHNVNENNYYAVTFLTSTLLEYLLNEDYVPTKDSKRYSKMKLVLKNEVFDYIDFEGLDEKFINKNLYCSTDKAEEFSRHTIHGTGLNMINHKNSFTIIFLYDFFESVLKIREGK